MTWFEKGFPVIKGSRDVWDLILNTLLGTAVDVDVRQQATYHIIGVENKTYTLELRSRYAYDIEDIIYKTNAGTCTVAVKIDGTDVGGLSAVSVTSTESIRASTTGKSVPTGADVTLVVSNISGATDLIINVWHNRTSAGTA